MNITTVKLNQQWIDTTFNNLGSNLEVSYNINHYDPWVNWGKGGRAGSLPAFQANLKAQSPTLSLVLDLKAIMMAGKEFQYDKNNTALHNFIEDNDQHAVFKEACKDECNHGGFALDLIYNAEGKIADVGYFNVTQTRPQNSIKPGVIYLCRDWDRSYQYNFNISTLPLYSKGKNFQFQPDGYREVYFSENENVSAGLNFYVPQESWRACIKYALIEAELAKYHLAAVTNGLNISGIFQFTSNPPAEEKAKLEQTINDNLSGVENTGTYMCFYDVDAKGGVPIFTPIKSENPVDLFNALNRICIEKICQANNVTGTEIVGLKTDGSVFTNNLSTAYEYFNSLVIKDQRKRLLNAFRKIYKQMGLIKSNDELDIKDLKPIQFSVSENVILANMNKGEIRKYLLGLDAIPEDFGNEESNSIGNSPVQTQVAHPAESRIAPAINPDNNIDAPNINNQQ